MAYKQQPGRPQMAKTGRGIPKQLMGPEGAKMAGGPEFDLIGAAKKVAKKIGKAHDAGMDAYYGSTRAASGMGDFGGGGGSRRMKRSYSRNPISYFSGAAKSLLND